MVYEDIKEMLNVFLTYAQLKLYFSYFFIIYVYYYTYYSIVGFVNIARMAGWLLLVYINYEIFILSENTINMTFIDIIYLFFSKKNFFP